MLASAAAWIASEGGAATESEMTIGNVSLSPKTLGAFTDVTRQLLIQSSLDVENLIRDDLTKAMATAIDKAGLEGTGASGEPTGIEATSGDLLNITLKRWKDYALKDLTQREKNMRNDPEDLLNRDLLDVAALTYSYHMSVGSNQNNDLIWGNQDIRKLLLTLRFDQHTFKHT